MERNAFYEQLTARNRGFLSPALQKRVRDARLLVAGCGLGSVIAECAVRAGFTHLALADGDTIEPHNLNRQMYRAEDIGRNKAHALAERLRSINPHAEIRVLPDMLNAENIPAVVAEADLVIDSVDFLDAAAILTLHAEARRQGKSIVAPMAVGWGGAAFVFAPGGPGLAELAGLDVQRPLAEVQYRELFLDVLQRYAARLPSYVLDVVAEQMAQIRERKPCPIAQLSGGTFSAAALSVSLAVRVLAGEPVATAPEMILLDPVQAAERAAAAIPSPAVA